MGFKEYVEKKKQDWSKYQAKKDAMKVERERTESLKLKLDASNAQERLMKLKENEK